MAIDEREDQYREPAGTVIPEPSSDNTPLPEPDAETAVGDAIDTDPTKTGTIPDEDS